MKKTTERTLLDLAFDITRANLLKGREYKKTKYVGDVKPKPKVKSKNHIIKTKKGTFFHVRGNMSGLAFKNMINKNVEVIDDFIQSDKKILKL